MTQALGGAVTGAGAAPAAANPPLSSLPDEIRSGYAFLPATVVGNLAGISIVLDLEAENTQLRTEGERGRK